MTSSDGLLIVDKPAGWTSHDVVARVRRLARTRKVGHAGTLDPMATGVLVLGVGRATRLLTFLVGSDKDYGATIRLGEGSTTDDAEGEIAPGGSTAALTSPAIVAAMSELTGPLQQIPSSFSAIKVNGVRAYVTARSGETPVLAARPVTVSTFHMQQLHRTATTTGEVIDLDVVCTVSSGTYVRALARDLGALLGVGGHLTRLQRTRVGAFTLAQAMPAERITEAEPTGSPPPPLPFIALADAATSQFPTRHLTEQEAWKVAHGQRILSDTVRPEVPVAALDPAGNLVAMLDQSEPTARSFVVFAAAGS